MHLLAAQPERNFSACRYLPQPRYQPRHRSRHLDDACAAPLGVKDEQTAAYSWGLAMGAFGRPTNGRSTPPLPTRTSPTPLARRSSWRARDDASPIGNGLGGRVTGGAARQSWLRMPLVAPFGRDYVAWAGDRAIERWLKGIGTPSSRLRQRLTAVLSEVRERGYVIERLGREYVRVHGSACAGRRLRTRPHHRTTGWCVR